MALVKLSFLVFLLSGSDAFWFTLNTDCTLDLDKIYNSKYYTPVFFQYQQYSNSELPNRFTIPRYKTVNIACPGRNNYLTHSNSDVTTATCIGNTTLQLSDGRQVDFKNLKCSKKIEVTFKTLLGYKNNCWPSTLFSIGYQIGRDFLEKIQLCYNKAEKSTVYAKHKVYLKDLEGKTHESFVNSFKANEVGLQKQILDKAYSKERDIDKGHLVPKADFATVNSQKLTYFYVNAFPQWNHINNGNWKNLEIAIRRLPFSDLTVITGTFGLRPDHKYLIPPFTLPVPQYAWKAVYVNSFSKGIVFLSLNNPKDDKIHLSPCDHCRIYNWGTAKWSDGIQGYIFCCQINQTLPLEIRRVLPTIFPSSVLKG